MLSGGLQAETANASEWQYGAAIDLSYAHAFQTDQAIPWRSKATSYRLNEFAPNMGMFYLRKPVDAGSRWGVEIGAHAGYDTDGQVPAMERLPGHSLLRYLSAANLSYLAPIGNGLKLTAGLMNSFIGFESIYAKDNPNYTRSWIADYSPFFLIGLGGEYRIDQAKSAGFYLLSDYDYLAYRSPEPKYAAYFDWALDSRWKLRTNVFLGPEQRNSAIEGWRYFSDTLLQWSNDEITLALAYDVGTERLVGVEEKQVLWMGSALFSRWHIGGPWSVALRPEVYWDADGKMTGNTNLITAMTATAEYKVPLAFANIALRGEYRLDHADNPQAGFFSTSLNSTEWTQHQHLLLFSVLIRVDN